MGGPVESAPPGPPQRFEIRATGATAKEYNFTAARGPIKTTNVIESIGHLVKSCLGGGVVGIHEAYKGCGLLSAVFLNILLGIFVSYCMHILVNTAQIMYGRLQIPAMSYPDMAEATLVVGPFKRLKRFARPFRYAVDATIGIDLFGSCCVYSVIISRTLKQLLEESKTVEYINIRILIASLLVPCVLICMILALKYLAPFSIVADICIATVAIATVYYGSKAATKSPLDFPMFKDVEGFLEFLGVCVFSMEGVGVSMPIENHMADPKKFPIVLIGGMSVVVSIVMTIGFFGYWGYGEKALSPVTLNFPWATFPIILKVFMALMIYVTFALNFWVPFDNVWFYLKKRHPPESWWIWERVYRAIMVVLIICIAIIFPNVSSFMGFLGCFCLSLMGFIFPAFIELCVIWEDPGLGFMKWRLVKYAVDATIGIDLFGSCCVYSVIISRTLKQLLEESKTVEYINIRILIASLLVPCVLICMILALKYLAPFSIVADICIATVAIATVYYGSKAATKSPLDFPMFKDVEGFLEFLGVCVFSMEGVGVSMPIENHMADPKKFPIVLIGGMSVVVSIVMTIGFFGYWGYGEKALSPVTLNFPWATFPIILKVFMALMIYVTFALNFWVPFDNVWFYLKKRHPPESWWIWERVYRAIMVVLIICIAIIFPNVSSFMGFLGCFCLSLMGFIFPAFIELCVIWEDPGLGFMKWRLVKCCLICTFGVVLCILGTYSNVKALLHSAMTAH